MISMTVERAQGLARHILTGVGGAFVSLGIAGTEEDWAKIAGAVVMAIGIVWSWLAPEKQTPAAP